MDTKLIQVQKLICIFYKCGDIEAILKCSHEYFLIWVDNFDRRLNEADKVPPHKFRGILMNVEKESRDKFIYYLRITSLKVSGRSLHFKESGVPIIVICALMEAACSYVLPRPSNLANEENLKFSGMGVVHISSERC